MNALKITAAILALAAASPALAQGKGKGNGHGNGHADGHGHVSAQANPSNGHCPPGLAKKDPPCVPPGHARDRDDRDHWNVGDRVDEEWIIVERDRYGLPALEEGEAYVRVGDRLLRVDREQRLILAILDNL